ncbi:hypothetical protein COJ60_21535 [Bacillus cereus]|uniref:hypothetical protein n=1 Tax=Bacillus TaxID=1386 RepID=UPI000BF8C485|nr:MULTISPECIES: hypothetical protein [Bacillus cereus group]PFN32590.1 hypothetical protein COJ60_21535 [Bacillus cereus]MCU5209675.1 hypothetical protein [Bacillus paranthracis]MDA2164221.1 hypothetical protein [Bacillus cereus group sp. Bc252]MDF9513492.1 hypothetical protein [Bacillus paranthracis]MDF9672454.1 hypothetical protein [Bacillus paranthracis]
MIQDIISTNSSSELNTFLRMKNKIVGRDFLLENTPYYLRHFSLNQSIAIENKEGSDLIQKDFIRLTNDGEIGNSITLEKVTIGFGSLDYGFRIKMGQSSKEGDDYITQNTLGRLYLYLDTRENATCWHIQALSENICTTITAVNSSNYWRTITRHKRKWIQAQTKRHSNVTIDNYWIFISADT